MLAAILALASCGQSHAAPTPTIEYRTPPPVTQVSSVVPSPPVCPCGLDSESQTPIPTATPTKTPIPTVAPPAPATAESQAVAPAPSSLDATLTAAGWPPSLLPWAEYIVGRESGGDPGAYNPSGASGLFQVMPSTWADMGCVGNPFDGFDNAVCAWQLYRVAGTSPWAVDP